MLSLPKLEVRLVERQRPCDEDSYPDLIGAPKPVRHNGNEAYHTELWFMPCFCGGQGNNLTDCAA